SACDAYYARKVPQSPCPARSRPIPPHWHIPTPWPYPNPRITSCTSEPSAADDCSSEKYVLLRISSPGARSTYRMSLPRRLKFPRSVLTVIVPVRPESVCEAIVTARTLPGPVDGTLA